METNLNHNDINTKLPRTFLIRDYETIVKDFVALCDDFKKIKNEIQRSNHDIMKDTYLNLHSELEAIYSNHNFCSFVEDTQKNSYFDISKAIDSIEFMRNVCSKVIGLINYITKKKNVNESTEEGSYYSKVQNKFIALNDSANKLQIRLLNELQPNEATTCAQTIRRVW